MRIDSACALTELAVAEGFISAGRNGTPSIAITDPTFDGDVDATQKARKAPRL